MKFFLLMLGIVGQNFAYSNTLVIGDSHLVGPVGTELKSQFDSRKQIATLYGSCGSTLEHWLTGKPTTCGYLYNGVRGPSGNTPLLKGLLELHRPETLMVVLATNYGPERRVEQLPEHLRQIKEVILTATQNGLKNCIWSGPPGVRPYSRQLLNQIEAALISGLQGVCDVIPVQDLTQYPDGPGDGIHYRVDPHYDLIWAWTNALMQTYGNSNRTGVTVKPKPRPEYPPLRTIKPKKPWIERIWDRVF